MVGVSQLEHLGVGARITRLEDILPASKILGIQSQMVANYVSPNRVFTCVLRLKGYRKLRFLILLNI